MEKRFDCVVCGSCVIDVLVRPAPLERPIGVGQLLRTEPLQLTTGGIVSNAGITMARLGQQVAAFTYVGDDNWAEIIRSKFEYEEIDASHLLTHFEVPTSTTAVLIDEVGERSFLHAVGAPKQLDKRVFLEHLHLFARSRMMLLGYYPLLPNLIDDLPEVLAAIRGVGCETALDSAGDGGLLTPLDRSLPHLDYYVPSLREASHQTGERDPETILARFREVGAAGLIGVKLGGHGALLSPAVGELVEIPAIAPPGPIVDTTGAGDSFFGGLLTGILMGMPLAEAGRLGAAAGAVCVTALGATTAEVDLATLCQLANLELPEGS